MAVLFGPMIIFGIYLLRNNQALLARRLKAREAETAQRWILAGFFLTFLALFIIPGLDYRFGWTAVPTWLVLVADLLVLVGYLLVTSCKSVIHPISTILISAKKLRLLINYASLIHCGVNREPLGCGSKLY